MRSNPNNCPTQSSSSCLITDSVQPGSSYIKEFHAVTISQEHGAYPSIVYATPHGQSVSAGHIYLFSPTGKQCQQQVIIFLRTPSIQSLMLQFNYKLTIVLRSLTCKTKLTVHTIISARRINQHRIGSQHVIPVLYRKKSTNLKITINSSYLKELTGNARKYNSLRASSS